MSGQVDELLDLAEAVEEHFADGRGVTVHLRELTLLLSDRLDRVDVRELTPAQYRLLSGALHLVALEAWWNVPPLAGRP